MVSLSDQKRKHQPFGSKQKKLKNQKNGKQQEKKGVKTFSFSIRCFLLEDGDLEIFFLPSIVYILLYSFIYCCCYIFLHLYYVLWEFIISF
jgi:hypothetical protein